MQLYYFLFNEVSWKLTSTQNVNMYFWENFIHVLVTFLIARTNNWCLLIKVAHIFIFCKFQSLLGWWNGGRTWVEESCLLHGTEEAERKGSSWRARHSLLGHSPSYLPLPNILTLHLNSKAAVNSMIQSPTKFPRWAYEVLGRLWLSAITITITKIWKE